MTANDQIVISAWQILVVVVLPLIGFGALLWRTWVKPAAEHQAEVAGWRKGVAHDIADLRKRIERHEQADQGIGRKLGEISKCLTEIKIKLARIEERIEERIEGRGR